MTISGTKYNSFKETAIASGIMEDDSEWDAVLTEYASFITNADYMRKLFAQILINCEPGNPKALWDKHKVSMSEDIFHVLRSKITHNDSSLIDQYAFNLCLQYIDLHLTRYGKSLAHIPSMPKYNVDLVFDNLYAGDLIAEELNYDSSTLSDEFELNLPKLNEDQLHAFNTITSAVFKEPKKSNL
jgi:hypothetical protein